ncbi:MAG: diguanylate cyclase [Pseudomonadota bacterium]
MDDFRELVSKYQDILGEIATIAAGHAANVISQMVNETVMINVPKISVLRLKELPGHIARKDEAIVCVHGRLLGETEGVTLVLFSRKDANTLANVLMNRSKDAEGPLSEMDLSAIKEVGNIIVGSFTTTLDQFVHIPLQPSAPGLIIDSIDNTVSFIEEQYGLAGKSNLFCIKSKFINESLNASGEFYILFQQDFVELAIEKVTSLYILSRKMAIYDDLTRLYSRAYFGECFEKEFEKARRYGGCLSLIMLDIDHFKKINDRYGHPEGDGILRQIAKVVGGSLRKVDVPVRYGGEEFILLLPETRLEQAGILAERLRTTIAAHSFIVNQKKVYITVSLGVAGYPESDVDSKDDLVFLADTALYLSKEKGRNMVSISTSSRKAVVLEDLPLKERRVFRRIEVEAPLQYITPVMGQDAIKVKEAFAKNISVSGIMFEAGEVIEPGSHVFLFMNIKLSESDDSWHRFRVFSEIQWVKGKENGKTMAGAKFIHLSPEDLRKMKDWLGEF